MICPSCESQNREGASYCRSCGGHLSPVCTRCGAGLPPDSHFCDACGASIGQADKPPVPRAPRDYTPKHLADKILQSKSALERGVVVNVAAGRVVRFIPALNIPEDDLGEAVDIVRDLVVG